MRVVEDYTLLMNLMYLEVRNVYGLIMKYLSYSLKLAEVFNVEDYVKNLVWEAAKGL